MPCDNNHSSEGPKSYRASDPAERRKLRKEFDEIGASGVLLIQRLKFAARIVDDNSIPHLLKLIDMEWQEARHYESLRMNVLSVFVTVASAVIAATYAPAVKLDPFASGMILVGLGGFGLLFVLRLTDAFLFHFYRRIGYSKALFVVSEGVPIGMVARTVDKMRRMKPSRMEWLQITWLWASIPGVVALFGIALLIPHTRALLVPPMQPGNPGFW
ncbi:MAG TPA: hypothetical protein VJ890_21715 [Vineibacter sp.]|nr:hypothetical protein [Vineibacter sp.]